MVLVAVAVAVVTSTSEVPVELEFDLEVLADAGMVAVVRSRCWSTAEVLEDIEVVRLGDRTRNVWGLDGEAIAEEFGGLTARFMVDGIVLAEEPWIDVEG